MEWAVLEGADLKSRLNERLSPQFERLGPIWRGDYYWVEQGNLSCRRVVRFALLKGLSAVLNWGLSFSFAPSISGSQISYHRTFKSARLDLFEGTHVYASGCSSPTSAERVSLQVGRFDQSLADYIGEVLPLVVSWFDRVRSLDEIAAEAERQMHAPRRGPTHHPAPAYVLAFVRAAQGNVDAGQEILKHALGAIDDDLWLRLENALESARGRSS
jgi:hypothetical protein